MVKDIALPIVEAVESVSKSQAQEWDQAQRNGAAASRIALYLLWRHEAWKTLGFGSFEEYCEKRTDVARWTVYSWISQIDTTCKIHGLSARGLLDNLTNEKEAADKQLLPVTYAMELRRLPTVEMQREAYKQFMVIKAGRMALSTDYVKSLQRLVSNMLQAHAVPEAKGRGKREKNGNRQGTPAKAPERSAQETQPQDTIVAPAAPAATQEVISAAPAPAVALTPATVDYDLLEFAGSMLVSYGKQRALPPCSTLVKLLAHIETIQGQLHAVVANGEPDREGGG